MLKPLTTTPQRNQHRQHWSKRYPKWFCFNGFIPSRTLHQLAKWVNELMKNGVGALSGEGIFLEGNNTCSGELMNLLYATWVKREKDKWIWVLESTNVFMVKSLYVTLSDKILPSTDLSVASRRGLRGIWTSLAPQKVQFFSWQLFLGRLPTRSNLSRRGALPTGVTSDCVWCPSIQEVGEHLFCRCSFVGRIWYSIFKWIGTGWFYPIILFHYLNIFHHLLWAKNI